MPGSSHRRLVHSQYHHHPAETPRLHHHRRHHGLIHLVCCSLCILVVVRTVVDEQGYEKRIPRLRGVTTGLTNQFKKWLPFTTTTATTKEKEGGRQEEPATQFKRELSVNIKNGTARRRFWSSQPIPQPGEGDTEAQAGPLERSSPLSAKSAPVPSLPEDLYFDTLDLLNSSQLEEVFVLLRDHYIEDTDGIFRFQYSKQLIEWASLVPGYKPEWFLGLREKSSGGQLVGYIMATPATICVDKKQLPMASIDFLTLRNDLRSQHLAPLLIQEITRRVNLCGVWQAFFTAGSLVAKPLVTTRYYHRMLNPQKLIHLRFAKVLPGMTVGEMESWLDLDEELPEKAFEVSPAAASTPPRKTACCDPFTFISKATSYSSSAKGAAFSMRMMTENDVKKVRDLWHRSCSDKYRLCATFSEEETRHFLSPREGLLWTFVATDPKKPHVITGFVSFYALPMRVLLPSDAERGGWMRRSGRCRDNTAVGAHGSTSPSSSSSSPSSNTIRVAHLYYYATDSRRDKGPSTSDLVNCALRIAKQQGFDVVNALEVLSNDPDMLREQKFLKGDADLHYYLFNYRVPGARGMNGRQVGILPL